MVWAVVMIWFYASGRVEKYLVERAFRIQVLVAGLAPFCYGTVQLADARAKRGLRPRPQRGRGRLLRA